MKYPILLLIFIPFYMNAMFYAGHDSQSVRLFLQRQDDPKIPESKLSAPIAHYERSQKEESDLENALGGMQKLLDQGASIHDYCEEFHLLWKVSISEQISEIAKQRLLSFLVRSGSDPKANWKLTQEAFFKNSVYEILETDPGLQQWATFIKQERYAWVKPLLVALYKPCKDCPLSLLPPEILTIIGKLVLNKQV